MHYGYDEANPRLSHHLTDIYDNADVLILQADYDNDQGYLISLTDAGGHVTNLDLSIKLSGGRIAAIVNNGVIDVFEVRDSRGNVLRRIQPLDPAGGSERYLVTVYRYNLRGLLTHESSERSVK